MVNSPYTERILRAFSLGNHLIMKALLEANDNGEPKDNLKNLLHDATKKLGSKPSKNTCNYNKCFKLALKYCSEDVNKQDEKGCTPLHYAARYRCDESVLELMRNGKKKT